MNTYKITHKGIEKKVQGDTLFSTMKQYCAEKDIDLNEIESCILIPKKEVKPIAGLSNTLISDLTISCDRTDRKKTELFEISISIVSMNKKGSSNVNRFFESLIKKQYEK